MLLPRGRARLLALAGFALLGLATLGLAWALVGDDDLELLLTEPEGLALLAIGIVAVVLGAIPLARYPAVVPVVLLAVAPFRIPVELGDEEAFLLLPLYLVLASAVVALAYRMLRGAETRDVPYLLALPLASFVAFSAASYLWTWDERAGAIALAFFVFPFTAGLAVVARAPFAAWLPRALLVTLVSLGAVFAAIGIWQAHTRTLFFARDVEVANAYTTFFRVTSLFKDPSLYGRYLVVPIAVLLVAVLLRRGRTGGVDRRGGALRVPLLGALLLVLAVELRRALRRDLRGRARRASGGGCASCCSRARSSRRSPRAPSRPSPSTDAPRRT